MRMSFTDNEIRSLWREILTDKSAEISRLNEPDSREKTLHIRYEDMDALNRDFALSFLKTPEEYLRLLNEELYENFLSESFKSNKSRRVDIRISSSLPDLRRSIRELRSADLNTFVQVEGIVKRVSEVVPTLTMAAYRCSYCRNVDLYPVTGTKLQPPVACSTCGKGKESTDFKFLPEKSIYIDMQQIEVQERPELLRGVAQPAKLSVHLQDEECGKLNPGDRVTINGILKGKQKFISGAPSNQFDIFLDAMYIEKESSEYEEIELSQEDVEEIKKAASDPDIYRKLVSSVAPTIYAMEVVKEAVIFQLFGGVRKVFDDGTYVRGDIHILLFGDPGTAKSQILKYAITLSPKSVYTSGKGASAAGLTAAAVKDEFSEGRWSLEAGTLVLADGGLAAVDELDKMSKEDSSALHEGMEQQTITISKAGINATLMSRCALLAAANPKFGRYDETEPFINQTDFPPTLLSRFDLIFVIVDRPGKSDVEMSNYILKVHSDGEKIAGGISIEKSEFKPYFDREFLKKYIVYARRYCFPVLSPGAKEKISKFYVDKRMSSKPGTVAITPRQLEALIRLSEASARIRLSDRVTEEDVERGIKLMESFLSQTTLVNGIPDIDIILTGYPSKERKNLLSLSEIIRKLEDENHGKDVSLSQIQEEAKGLGLSLDQVERNIKLLRERGQLIEPRSGYYRLIRT
ncbi:MAG: minichromosome maintenance protein MCM [Thermoplasmatales archaeon]